MDELTKTETQRALDLPEVPPADELAVNSAGSWVHDKLMVVRKYDSAFGVACQSWGEWFYVDGLAGSGVDRIAEEGGRLIWGTPVIALRATPPFTNCLFLEQDAARAAALDQRTTAFTGRRIVEQGEVNTDLIRMMRMHLPRRNPVLVVLDPYGMEIDWATVRDIAAFRQYKWKAEILMLFPIDGINRAMKALGDVDERTLDRFWGDKSWHQLWKEEKFGQLRTPDQTRNRGLQLYTDKLKQDLGYKHALAKDVRRAGHTGGLKNILVFATDNGTGAKIMDHVFDGPGRGEQLRFPGMPNPLRRDR
ncbi:MAG: three-Cys-motif partner protein TcmP [Actinomycetota bacterium]